MDLLQATGIPFSDAEFPNRGTNKTQQKEYIEAWESWDLKNGGLEIPEICYTGSNPSIQGSNDS